MHASALFKYSCLHKFIVNFFRELKRKTKIRIKTFRVSVTCSWFVLELSAICRSARICSMLGPGSGLSCSEETLDSGTEIWLSSGSIIAFSHILITVGEENLSAEHFSLVGEPWKLCSLSKSLNLSTSDPGSLLDTSFSSSVPNASLCSLKSPSLKSWADVDL